MTGELTLRNLLEHDAVILPHKLPLSTQASLQGADIPQHAVQGH